MKDIRWKQRFENFQKAFQQLSSAIDLKEDRDLSEIEQQGFIKAYGESRAITAIRVISKDYYPQIKEMNLLFEQKKNEE